MPLLENIDALMTNEDIDTAVIGDELAQIKQEAEEQANALTQANERIKKLEQNNYKLLMRQTSSKNEDEQKKEEKKTSKELLKELFK